MGTNIYTTHPPINIQRLETLVTELKGWGANGDEREEILNEIIRICNREVWRLTGEAIRKARGEDDGDDRDAQRLNYAYLCPRENPEVTDHDGFRDFLDRKTGYHVRDCKDS